MTSSVSNIAAAPLPGIAPIDTGASKPGGFQSVLEGIIGGVEQSQTQANKAVASYLSGGNEEIHSVALATQRAQLQFDLFMQVRNKVISAYQEIMKMQV
jgi:flagellar hook-basal body complex protein FliE